MACMLLTASLSDGRAFIALCVSGEIIMVSFMDDPMLCLIDGDFSDYTATVANKPVYMDGSWSFTPLCGEDRS